MQSSPFQRFFLANFAENISKTTIVASSHHYSMDQSQSLPPPVIAEQQTKVTSITKQAKINKGQTARSLPPYLK